MSFTQQAYGRVRMVLRGGPPRTRPTPPTSRWSPSPTTHGKQALLRAAAGRDSGPLLLKNSGRSYVRQEIAALPRTLCHRAALQTRLTPHGMRATFITLALNDGVALRDVQDAARYADPRTTRLDDRDSSALSRHPVHRLLGLATA